MLTIGHYEERKEDDLHKNKEVSQQNFLTANMKSITTKEHDMQELEAEERQQQRSLTNRYLWQHTLDQQFP